MQPNAQLFNSKMSPIFLTEVLNTINCRLYTPTVRTLLSRYRVTNFTVLFYTATINSEGNNKYFISNLIMKKSIEYNPITL